MIMCHVFSGMAKIKTRSKDATAVLKVTTCEFGAFSADSERTESRDGSTQDSSRVYSPRVLGDTATNVTRITCGIL